MTVRITRRRLAVLVGLLGVVVALIGYSAAAQGSDGKRDHERGSESYTVGLFGDMPYNASGRAEYPALLQDINASHVEFSVFDGDLKAGGDGPCSDQLYYTSIANFNTLKRPLIWVPGDNDWTDCWGRYGPSQQPYSDPEERLARERQLFDSTNQSLG